MDMSALGPGQASIAPATAEPEAKKNKPLQALKSASDLKGHFETGIFPNWVNPNPPGPLLNFTKSEREHENQLASCCFPREVEGSNVPFFFSNAHNKQAERILGGHGARFSNWHPCRALCLFRCMQTDINIAEEAHSIPTKQLAKLRGADTTVSYFLDRNTIVVLAQKWEYITLQYDSNVCSQHT